jgi:hypothetical protein
MRGSCARIASATCAPTRITGFSEVIGSWKIIAISRPRTARHSSSVCPTKFLLSSAFLCVLCAASNQISPLTRAPGGNNPINANDNIVFPLPDSPTNPTDSPAPIPSRTHPAGVANSTVSPFTFSNSFTPKS